MGGMRVIKPPIPLSQWSELIPKIEQAVPDGFQNITEIAQATGMSYCQVSKKLRDLLAAGKIESIQARPPGKRNPMTYYRSPYYAKPEQRKKHSSNR